jgi:hypothetical protein
MRALLPAGLLLATLVSGCAQDDPYTRDGMWQPEGINDQNLAAMAANPADLLHGHGESRPQPRLATVAVTRLLAGSPTPLPVISADVTPGSGAISVNVVPAAATAAAGGN